jgi:hypothetical protein
LATVVVLPTPPLQEKTPITLARFGLIFTPRSFTCLISDFAPLFSTILGMRHRQMLEGFPYNFLSSPKCFCT